MRRLLFLWALVIGAGAATVWVGVMAAETGHLDGQVLMALMPLVLLISIAWRGIAASRRRDGGRKP